MEVDLQEQNSFYNIVLAQQIEQQMSTPIQLARSKHQSHSGLHGVPPCMNEHLDSLVPKLLEKGR